MGKISIQDMAKAVADKHGLSQQDAEAFVTALFDVVNEGLHDDKSVKVKGLGTFKVIDVRERESVNVNTGERVVIESHGKITFTPDPIMRDLVNKPFAQFETVVINDGVDLDEMSKIQTQEDETDDVQESPKDEATPEDDNVEPVQEHTVEPLLTTATDVTQIDEAESDEEPARESEEVSQEPDEIETSSNVNSEPDDAQPESHADNDGEENELEEVKTQGASHENVGETSVPVANEETVVVRVHDKKLLSRYRWLLFSVIVFLVGAIALGTGFYLGRRSVKPIVRYKTVHIVGKHALPSATKVDRRKDSVKSENVSKQQPDKVEPVEDEKPKERPAVEVQEQKALPQDLVNANAMVKTGAYRIVGTSKTITVGKGESLERISRFYLGDGMKCYIQVHNGIVDVKEGMKLKIPKLELKRKK